MITDTDGLVIARFEHRTSRALDPQLHSHCLILNKVRDAQDGSWRALHGRLFEEAKTAGMLYQAALRAELTRRLGVAWGPVSEHGQAELAGIPTSCWHASAPAPPRSKPRPRRRSPSSKRALGGRWRPMNGGGSIASRCSTRVGPNRTSHVAEVSLYERWAAEARDAGWEPAGVVEAAIGGPPPWCAPHARHTWSATSWTGCASSGRRSPAATSCKRSAGHVDPAVGRTPRARLVRDASSGSHRRRAGRPDGGLSASHRNAVEPPRTLVRRDGGSVWDPPQAATGTRPARCSPSRAGSCTPRRSAAPRGVGLVTAETLDRAIADEANPARYGPARRATRHHEPGPTDRSRDRSRRHRQDHHAARRRDPAWDNAGYQGDRPRPHRGSRRRAAQRSRHARGDRRQVLRTGTTTSATRRLGSSPHATWSSSTKPACSPPETSIASSHVARPRRQTRPGRRPPATRRHPRTRRHVRRARRHPRRASSSTRRIASPTAWEAHALAQLRRGDRGGLEALAGARPCSRRPSTSSTT